MSQRCKFAAVAVMILALNSSFTVQSSGMNDPEPEEPKEILPIVQLVPEPDNGRIPGDDREAVDPLAAEKKAIAQTVWGEARGCDVDGQESVIWCILDRYDDGRFGDTILEVISRDGQFDGYSPSYPVWDSIYEVTENVVNRWLSGEEGPGYLYFTGDGKTNHFR